VIGGPRASPWKGNPWAIIPMIGAEPLPPPPSPTAPPATPAPRETPGPTAPPAAPAAGGEAVRDPRAATGGKVVLDRLEKGKSFFSDRTEYVAPKGGDEGKTDSKVLDFPARLAGAAWIRTANGDKDCAAAEALSFTLARPARVLVALDSEMTAPPAWMKGWRATGEAITYRWYRSDKKAPLYESPVLPAGRVVLGGNQQGLKEGKKSVRNYGVVVVPEP